MKSNFQFLMKKKILEILGEYQHIVMLIILYVLNVFFNTWNTAYVGMLIAVLCYALLLIGFKQKKANFKNEYLLLPLTKNELLTYVFVGKFIAIGLGLIDFVMFMCSMYKLEKNSESTLLPLSLIVPLVLLGVFFMSIMSTFNLLKHSYSKKKNIQRFCEVLRMISIIFGVMVLLVFTIVISKSFLISCCVFLALNLMMAIIVYWKADYFIFKEINYFKSLSFKKFLDVPLVLLFLAMFVTFNIAMIKGDQKIIQKTTKSS